MNNLSFGHPLSSWKKFGGEDESSLGVMKFNVTLWGIGVGIGGRAIPCMPPCLASGWRGIGSWV